MVQEALNKDEMIIDLSRENVKTQIKEVCDAGLIDLHNINDDLLADIKKYGLLTA